VAHGLVEERQRDTAVSAPRLLELFAGEGGAAYGYKLAGFDVTAVDDQVRPGRAPGITWVTGDATTYPLDGFDVVTGGPPCTDHTTLANVAEAVRGGSTGTGWMLEHTLERFDAHASRTGALWVVENVEGAKADMPNPLKLCGSMFGLIDEGWLLRRHRYFSSSAFLMAPGPCRCAGKKIIGVYGDLTASDRRCAGQRATRPNGDMRASVTRARRLLEMPWATAEGLSLAIPPAYTSYIAEQLLCSLSA
jgi:DNA (cytosine-5)-methyltransferase 1